MKIDRKRAAELGGKAAVTGARTVGSVIGLIFKILGTIVLIGIMTVAIMACIFTVYVRVYIEPELELDLKDISLNQSSVIYYKDKSTGQWEELVTIYQDQNRIWVDYDSIPKMLERAAVAIEDKRFYRHNGVDWYRTLGALKNMVFPTQDTFGGSTITQQLIKNLTGDDEVTVMRKLTEIFRAVEFERKYSKEDIMEWYLNTIYFGRGCYGVSTAANMYFGKELSELTIADCAALIAITNNPSLYDPYTRPENNRDRQLDVLFEMYDQGYITKAEYDKAVEQEMVFRRGETDDSGSEYYTYFEDLVINDVIDAIADLKGITTEIASKFVHSAGYKIYATIDMEIQAIVDEVYSNPENMPSTYGSEQQLQSAITIIDNSTGYIVAICGGVGEKTASRGWSRATDTKRPPGSSLKPLSVYAPALELGIMTPVSVYDDAPLDEGIVTADGDWPKNDDRTYRGLLAVYEALRDSRNAVAAQILVDLTPQVSFSFLTTRFKLELVAEKELNGQILSDVDYAPLALGQLTDGVSTREMATAFATFPNDGMYVGSCTFSLILDNEDKVVINNDTREREAILSEKTAYYINTMLTSAVSGGTGTEARLSNMITAGKTGTTGDNCDRWFCGYTPYYSAAVWTGYDTPETINMSVRGNPAAQIWKTIMERIHEGLEYREFSTPNNLVYATTCKECGLLSSEYTTSQGSFYLVASDVPSSLCAGDHKSKIMPSSWVLNEETGKYYDTVTGWEVDIDKRMLIHPDTGQYYTQDEAEALIAADIPSNWVYNSDSGKYYDTITGWEVNIYRGWLRDPETGVWYREAEAQKVYISYNALDSWAINYSTNRYYDTITGWYVDPATLLLINPATGELFTQEAAEDYISSGYDPIGDPEDDVPWYTGDPSAPWVSQGANDNEGDDTGGDDTGGSSGVRPFFPEAED